MPKRSYNAPQLICSVSTPSVQIPVLYSVDNQPKSDITNVVESLLANPNISDTTKLMIDLMYTNGLRVSELLRIRGTDILHNGSYVIHASKGSSDRIGHVSTQKVLFLSHLGSPYPIFDGYSRQSVYNIFRKHGISSATFGNTNRSVTHLLRHNYIESVMAASGSLQCTQSAVGHKSTRSTLHYIDHNIINP